MQLDAVLAILGPSRPTLTKGTGGGELTPELVRGALGMLKDQDGASLLYSKVRGDVNLSEMERRLFPRWLARAEADGWRSTHGRPLSMIVAAMLRLALLEFLVPSRCPRCSGRKTTYNRASKTDIPCARCHGRGELPLRESERAASVHIPPQAWRSKWSGRYRQIQVWLDDLYESAAADLHRVLR